MIKTILATAATAALLAFSSATPGFADGHKKLTVTLLGTGTPFPSSERFGPGILIEAGDKKLLFDVGRGVTQRLFQKKIPLGKIDHVFLTHLHSDHVVGIPDLWLSGWLGAPWARRKGPFTITGPEGTVNLMTNLERAYEWDIKTRIADQNLLRDRRESGMIGNFERAAHAVTESDNIALVGEHSLVKNRIDRRIR